MGPVEHIRPSRTFLQDMQVVNNAAERAVKDAHEYAHMNRASGDRGNVVLVASDRPERFVNLCKLNLSRV